MRLSTPELRHEIDRARHQYASADAKERRFARELEPRHAAGAERARERGWKILRAVLEQHPWRPKVVKATRRRA